MPDESIDSWAEVLKQALDNADVQPIVGTKFRQAVNFAARQKGLHFPPQNEPRLRFIELLERYPKLLSILRRPGQDFLVASAENSAILAESVQDRTFIRSDFFGAFTVVSPTARAYDRTNDRIIWLRADGPPVNQNAVQIPIPTEADEIELRRQFISNIDSESDVGRALISALQQPLPLHVFGKVVKETGLHKKWHAFRTARVVDRIQSWAAKNGVDWKDAWLLPKFFRATPEIRVHLQDAQSDAASPAAALSQLLSRLDAADLQRISVPLDLVLKAVSQK